MTTTHNNNGNWASTNGWMKVVFLDDCTFQPGDDDKEDPVCPRCGESWNECPCPGSGQEDMFDYADFDGELYARLKVDDGND